MMTDQDVEGAFDATCATHAGFNGPSCPKCDEEDARAEEAEGWTHNRIVAAIGARYEREGYAFMSNVPSNLGWQSKRYADGVAVAMWESRGFAVVGFEAKATRNDFLRELKDPPKADGIYGYCDEWVLAVADKEMVRDGELPPTWGLMAPRGKNLEFVVRPPKLTPRPLDRPFLCALLRRAHERMNKDSGAVEAHQRGYEEGRLKGTKDNAGTLLYLQREHERLKKNVAAFQGRSGVNIDYDGGPIGASLKALFEKDYGSLQDALRRMEGNLKEALGLVMSAKEELKTARKPPQ